MRTFSSFVFLLTFVVAIPSGCGQPPGGRRGGRGGGEETLKQPFVGITSDGKIEKGLFRFQENAPSVTDGLYLVPKVIE